MLISKFYTQLIQPWILVLNIYLVMANMDIYYVSK